MSEIIQNGKRKFIGKFRGTVEENQDPLGLGRIQAKIPQITSKTGWALPSVPYAGSGVGFFFIPPKNANVWIEFEGGDTEKPIWTGCFWGLGESPTLPAQDDIKMIKTKYATITINDLLNSLEIESKDGLKIIFDTSGIELKNNSQKSVKLTVANVSINNGSLEVL